MFTSGKSEKIDWEVEDNISDIDEADINWLQIAELYAGAPLVRRPSVDWKRAFAASSEIAFVRLASQFGRAGRVIGAARAISDGQFYATILDVGVDAGFQRQGIGRALVSNLLERLKVERVYLTSAAGKQGFYHRLGFLKLNNAFGYYAPGPRAEAMELGLISPPNCAGNDI